MSLYSFIKDSAELDGISGDICTDILRDKEFPVKASDVVQINYVNRKALYHNHIRDSLKELISSYRQYQSQNVFALRKANYPIELPEKFNIGKVLIKGMYKNFYKVYLFDETNDMA